MGATVGLTATPAGGTWSGTGVSGSTFSAVGLAAGTYSVTYTVGGACGGVDVAVVTVTSAATPNADNKTVCVGATVGLTATPAGGTWSGTGVSGSTFSAVGLAAGTYSVTYTVGGACGGVDVAVVTVTSAATPNADNKTVCVGATVGLTATPAGGTWSGTGVSGSTFSAVGLAAGTYSVTYTVGGACGGVDVAVVTVTSAATPNADNKTVCVGATVGLTATPAGGTWSGTGVSGSTFSAVGLAAGTYSVTYTVGGACGGVDVAVVTVTSAATPNADNKTVCVGATVGLTATPAGGTWSGTGVSGSTFSAVGLAAGTYSVTYTVGGACGGVDVAVVTVTSAATPNADNKTVCVGATVGLTATPAGGTWSGTGVSGSTFSAVGLAAGTYSVTYTVGGACGGVDVAVVTVTSAATPNADNKTVCVGATVGLTATPAGGTWSGTGVSGSTFSAVGLAAGTYSVTYTVGGACGGVDVAVVTVTSAATPNADNKTVCVGATVGLTATPAGGTWSGTGVSGSTFSAVGLAAGTYSVTYTVGGACGGVDVAVVTVTSAATPNADNKTVCVGATVGLTATPAGGTWSGTGVSGSTFSAVGLAAGTYSVTYTVGGACGGVDVAVVTVTSAATPNADNKTVCVGATVGLTATPAGGTWSGTGVSGSTFSAVGLAAGTYSVTYTVGGACGGVDVAVVTVTSAATPNADNKTVCVGATVGLTATPAGGTWSGTGVSGSTFSAVGLAAGTYSVTYTVGGACGGVDVAVVTVTSAATPNADNKTVCVGATVGLTATPAGGTWSGTGVSGSTFSAVGLAAGTYSVTYTVGGACGGVDVAVVTVTSAATPNADNKTVCVGATVGLTATPAGGTWSGTGVSGSTFSAVGLAAGTYSVTYTVGGACGGVDVAVVTVTSAATPNADNKTVCVGATVGLTATPAGGTWSGTGVSGSTFSAVGLAAGTYSVTYTVGGACGGVDVAVVTVTSAATPNADNKTVCVGATVGLTATPAGGTWSGTGVSGSTFSAVGLAAGTYSVTYTVGGACGGVDVAVVTVTSAATPNADNKTVCVGATVGLTATPAGGTWSGTGVSGSTFSAVGLAAGTYSVTYTVGGACGGVDVAVVTVTSAATPNADNKTVCVGATVGLTATPAGGTWSGTGVSGSTFSAVGLAAGTYSVTYTVGGACGGVDVAVVTVTSAATPNADNKTVCVGATVGLTATPAGGTWSGTGVSGSTFSAVGLAAGTYSVTYTVGGACGGVDVAVVTVTSAATPNADNKTVCVGATVGLTATPAGGTWSGTGVSGSTFSAVGLAAGTYSVTYTVGGACGGVDVAVVTVTSAATPNADNKTVCVGATVGLTATPAGGTWSGTGVSGSTFSAVGLAAGTYSVTYTVGGACGGVDVAVVTVTSAATPNADNKTVCVGATVGLTATPAGGTWSGTGVSGSTFSAVGLAAGTYSVTYTVGGACGGVDVAVVTVSGIIATTIEANATCAGGDGSINLNVSGGIAPYTYLWNNGATTQDISGLSAGTYSVTITDSKGCTATESAMITQPTSPNLIVNNPAPVCKPASVDLRVPAITNGSSLGLTFTYWMNPEATVPLNSPGEIISGGTYYIKAVNSEGCSVIKPVVVIIDEVPTVTVNSSTICADGGFANIIATPTPAGNYTYAWSVPAGVLNPGNVAQFGTNTPGTYSVTIANSSGCSATGSGTLNATPVAAFGETDPICAGASATVTINLVGTPPFQITYSDGANTFVVNSINTNTYQFTVQPQSTTTYSILNVKDAKCSNSSITSTVTVTVFTTPGAVRYPTLTTPPNEFLPLDARILGNNHTYSWSPGAGLNNFLIRNPVFRYDRTTEYFITITSPEGCSVIDTLLVRVLAQAPPSLKSDIFVPKAWSPNKDGHNDKLFPLTVNIAELKYFRIFNRWGQLVFETNRIGDGWDGIFKSQPQVMDVYTWTLEAIGEDGVYYKRSGNSALLR